MNEIWKSIKGFEGYEVSNFGNVRTVERVLKRNYNGVIKLQHRKSKVLSKAKDTNGYLLVHLRKNKIDKQFLVHRLVAQEFILNPENKPYINHINGKKDDNLVTNLEWCTQQENIDHSIKNGTFQKTAKHKPVCKMDEEENVLEVFRSAYEASVILGRCNGSKEIRRVCKQGYGHYAGFRWKWL